MSNKKKCLMAVGPSVHEGFFNAEVIAKIADKVELRDEVQHSFDQAKYSEVLLEYKPEILITGWGSPKLTSETHDLMGKSVKIIHHSGGAINYVVDKVVMEKGVLVTNWGDTAAPSIAEATLMMMLASLRRVPYCHNLLHFRKGWRSEDINPEGLFYQKVGIHGFGKISRALVKLMKPFSCKVSTYSPHVPDSILKEYGVERASTLEDLYSTNRILVNLASKTNENYHIVNKKVLSLMPDGAHLVLTGRGSVVDTEALVAELKTGRLFAALDVFEKEPLDPESPLRGLDNCMLIPHCGGPTPDRYIDMGWEILENIDRFLHSKPLINEVPVKLYDFMT